MSKALGIMNLSYNDESRTEDYLLKIEGSSIPRKFNLPKSIQNFQRMYPKKPFEFICDDESMDAKYYSAEQIDAMLEDFTYDVELHIADMFSIASVPTSTIKNDDQLYMQIVDTSEK